MNLQSPCPPRQQLLETLTLAFLEDPLYRWLYPDETTRPHALLVNFQLTLTLARDRGHVETTPAGDGIALWTDPGVELLDDPAPFLQLLQRWAPERVEPALAGMAASSLHGDPSDAVQTRRETPPDEDPTGAETPRIPEYRAFSAKSRESS